jgi:hypothetical protein
MVGNEIPSICFYFCSMERIQVVFFSAEWFRTDSESLLLLTACSSGTNQFFRLFRLPQNKFFVGNCQPYPGVVDSAGK